MLRPKQHRLPIAFSFSSAVGNITRPAPDAGDIDMAQRGISAFDGMDRAGLLQALQMFAKNWLAHDGSWFLAAEERFGMETAIGLDAASWKRFAAVEARRIMSAFDIREDGGLTALERALQLRPYAILNIQHMEWSSDRSTLRFFMDACRVQDARRRRGLPDFPCRAAGTIEFEIFAATIDPRIQTKCLHCPPNAPAGLSCGWEFTLGGQPAGG